MSIAAVEQYLIDVVKARFGARLKGVESLPTDWDAAMFERALRLAPGVFIAFGGGRAIAGSDDIESQWVVLAVTAHASGELARRRGDSREIGAYEIIETVVPLLNDLQVPDTGRLTFAEIENLFTGTLESKGVAIYGARFTMPLPLATSTPTGDALADFITFHADHDLAPADGVNEAADTVTLPQ